MLIIAFYYKNILRKQLMSRLCFCLFLLVISIPSAFAHHTWTVEYEREVNTEIEGVISSIAWVNPHVKFKVIVDQGTDKEQEWDIAGTSVSNLARMDVTKNILSVGDKVRMAGHGSKRSDHAMYMINLMLPDGREAVFSSSASLRWTDERIGSAEKVRGDVIEKADISKRPDSIFAVWATLFGDPESRSLHPRNTGDFPLTPLGLQAIADYNPETDDPFGECSPKGGAAVMDAPYPMELVDKGDTILLKLEEYDTVRTIHLKDIHDDSKVAPSLLGYSTGHWQGDTLLVTTTKIDYPFLHVGSTPSYIPQSSYARMQETFRLAKEHDRLYYTLTITDTDMLTKPMVLSKFYQWRPDEALQPYKCDES
jgi:hypothetical protein